MSPMTLQTVTVRIPTEREAAPDVEVSNGGLPTIPTEARMLPQAPLHRATGVSGQEDHLGVPFEVADAIDVGDLVALPDVYGRPWAVFEVLEHAGPWAKAFPLPEGMDDEFAGWVHLRARPARDKVLSSFDSAKYLEDRWKYAKATEDSIRRAALKRRDELVERITATDPAQLTGAIERLDDDARTVLEGALDRAAQEAAEQEAPVAA